VKAGTRREGEGADLSILFAISGGCRALSPDDYFETPPAGVLGMEVTNGRQAGRQEGSKGKERKGKGRRGKERQGETREGNGDRSPFGFDFAWVGE
jgi:hypothetical protein